MLRSRSWLVALSVAVLALACGDGRAGEADTREGWTQVESVPEWVAAPPARHGYFHLVDCARSNLLDLAYPDTDTETAKRNVRLEVTRRLAPVLGADAQAPAEAAAAVATATRRVYHFQPAAPGQEEVVGAQTYTVFVLWEVPFAPVLAAAREDAIEAVTRELAASPAFAAAAWKRTSTTPPWVEEPPAAEGRLRVATRHSGGSWSVVEAVANLRAASVVGSAVQARLRPVLGGDLASEVGVMARGASRLLERARLEGRPKGWQLWEVRLDDVLTHVPTSHREAAREALGRPPPPRPWNWEEEVGAEPVWVAEPPAWPGHVPVVQVRRSDLLELAKERSAKLGEKDVAKIIATRLEKVLGADLAREAGARGARKRQLVRKAIHERQPTPQREPRREEVPGSRLVTVWTLWQVPLDAILDGVSAERREAARAVLTTP